MHGRCARDGRLMPPASTRIRPDAVRAPLGRHLITRRRDSVVLDEIFQDARRVTPDRNLEKLTIRTRGWIPVSRQASRPRTRVGTRTATDVANALKDYALTLTASRRADLRRRYRPADVAFKRVGTGQHPVPATTSCSSSATTRMIRCSSR